MWRDDVDVAGSDPLSAMCVQGGGQRQLLSLVATRVGMYENGLLEVDFDFNIGTSGGGWAALVAAYVHPKELKKRLGPFPPEKQMTLAKLRAKPDMTGRNACKTHMECIGDTELNPRIDEMPIAGCLPGRHMCATHPWSIPDVAKRVLHSNAVAMVDKLITHDMSNTITIVWVVGGRQLVTVVYVGHKHSSAARCNEL